MPPTDTKVAVLFTAKITEDGDKLNGVVTVKLASTVLPAESVTLTVAVPLDAGAVKSPVVGLIDPVPVTIENVYGVTPFAPVNVMVVFTKTVCDVGEIVSAGFTVTNALAVAPRLSVTRTVALPETGVAV